MTPPSESSPTTAVFIPDTTRRRVVEVHSLADEIRIYDGSQLVAAHAVVEGRGQRVIAEGHRRYPPPGNAKIGREGAVEQRLGMPGEQVTRRPLAVYEHVATVLAAHSRTPA